MPDRAPGPPDERDKKGSVPLMNWLMYKLIQDSLDYLSIPVLDPRLLVSGTWIPDSLIFQNPGFRIRLTKIC